MKKSTRILIMLISLLFSTTVLAQTSWNYISPKPGSKYINPQNTIAFRHGDVIDISSVKSSAITVNSSLKGEISGSFILSTDMRTLIFYPDNAFELKDNIQVKLAKGIRTVNGPELEGVEFHFSVKEVDNTQMLIEFYEKENLNETKNVQNNNQGNEEDLNSLDKSLAQSYPDRFPVPLVTEFDNPSPGYVFSGPRPMGPAPYDPYLLIMDNYGIPVFYRNWPRRTNDFKTLVNNQLTFCDFDNGNPITNKYIVLNSHFEVTDSLMMGNGYVLDQHDILMLENGDHFLMAYDPQLVNMDTVFQGGDTAATVIGFIIQKLDANHNVIFQWRSWDHFDILDANHTDFTGSKIDYVHGNAFELDTDGNFLFSCRNMEEITKISLETGEIIWRFGLHAKNNMFTFTNDTTGFSWQHDIRRISNGNVTVYDNGNYHTPSFSQALEYQLDEVNFTAELVWNYIHDPVVYGRATGAHRRLANNNAFICWGLTWPINASEVTMDGTLAWELNWPNSVWEYRVFKFDWTSDYFTTSFDTIDYGEYDGYSAWPQIVVISNNTDQDIEITSTHNHWDSYYVSTALPLTVPANATANITVNFFPTMQGQINDVLTLNYESMYSDTLPQCISRQIHLMGYVPDPTPPVASMNPEEGEIGVSQLMKPIISFDEPVEMVGGGTIKSTDLQDMIIFKEGDSNGEDVAFSAFMNAWKTVITITPDTLKPLTKYYVELKANSVQDKEGNQLNAAQFALWQTEEEQGVEELDIQNVSFFPNPTDGLTYLQFDEEIPLRIKVVNILGKQILTIENPTGKTVEVDLKDQPSGVYIVQLVFDPNSKPQSLKIVKE